MTAVPADVAGSPLRIDSPEIAIVAGHADRTSRSNLIRDLCGSGLMVSEPLFR